MEILRVAAGGAAWEIPLFVVKPRTTAMARSNAIAPRRDLGWICFNRKNQLIKRRGYLAANTPSTSPTGPPASPKYRIRLHAVP